MRDHSALEIFRKVAPKCISAKTSHPSSTVCPKWPSLRKRIDRGVNHSLEIPIRNQKSRTPTGRKFFEKLEISYADCCSDLPLASYNKKIPVNTSKIIMKIYEIGNDLQWLNYVHTHSSTLMVDDAKISFYHGYPILCARETKTPRWNDNSLTQRSHKWSDRQSFYLHFHSMQNDALNLWTHQSFFYLSTGRLNWRELNYL